LLREGEVGGGGQRDPSLRSVSAREFLSGLPGWIMTEKQLTEWVTAEAEESIVRNQCLPDKVYPDDVARLLLWLAADDSRSCTAQRWIVDGGWM
jgi:NAD(P)-dependent dehydrogenase (short-subunit alcohol dehydrogenase family)